MCVLTQSGFSQCVTVKKGQTAGHYSICSGGRESRAPNHAQFPAWFRAARCPYTVWARATTLSKIACFTGWAGPCLRDKLVTCKRELAIFQETYCENRDFKVSSLRPFSVSPVCSVSSRSRWHTLGQSNCDATSLGSPFLTRPVNACLSDSRYLRARGLWSWVSFLDILVVWPRLSRGRCRSAVSSQSMWGDCPHLCPSPRSRHFIFETSVRARSLAVSASIC